MTHVVADIYYRTTASSDATSLANSGLVRRYSKMRRKTSMMVNYKEPERLEAAESMGLPCSIDGPYGAPASNIFRASHAVLIATGIGVTPFSSILQASIFASRYQVPRFLY